MGVYHIHETNITDNVYIVLGKSLYNGHFSRRENDKSVFWLQSREDWTYIKDKNAWTYTYALVTRPLEVVDKNNEEFAGCKRCGNGNAFIRKVNGELLNVELLLWKDKCFVTNDYRDALDTVMHIVSDIWNEMRDDDYFLNYSEEEIEQFYYLLESITDAEDDELVIREE